MSLRHLALGASVCMMSAGPAIAIASAQTPVPPEGPTVAMSVAAPGAQAQQLTTHESGLATLDVAGHHYGFRPTMHDDAGHSLTVTIFDMGGPGQPVRELGTVDLTGGGPAVTSRTAPAFSVKASKGVPQPDGRPVPQTTRK